MSKKYTEWMRYLYRELEKFVEEEEETFTPGEAATMQDALEIIEESIKAYDAEELEEEE